jgi:hypothetical protein
MMSTRRHQGRPLLRWQPQVAMASIVAQHAQDVVPYSGGCGEMT